MVLRAGVIGLGKKGWLYDFDEKRRGVESHVSAYRTTEGFDLVAVSDKDPELLAKFTEHYPSIRTYVDPQDMFYKEKLDVVSVVTPVETHGKLVRLACRYHPLKVIFCEKPIAATVEDAKDMIESCKNFGVRLLVNHQRRWDLFWRSAKYNVESIEPILRCVGATTGHPFEAGIHMADLFNWYGEDAPFTYINLFTKKPYEPYLLFEIDVIGVGGRIRLIDNGGEMWVQDKLKQSTRYSEIWELEPAKHIYMGFGGIDVLQSPMQRAVISIRDHINKGTALDLSEEDAVKALEICKTWWNEKAKTWDGKCFCGSDHSPTGPAAGMITGEKK